MCATPSIRGRGRTRGSIDVVTGWRYDTQFSKQHDLYGESNNTWAHSAVPHVNAQSTSKVGTTKTAILCPTQSKLSVAFDTNLTATVLVVIHNTSHPDRPVSKVKNFLTRSPLMPTISGWAATAVKNSCKTCAPAISFAHQYCRPPRPALVYARRRLHANGA